MECYRQSADPGRGLRTDLCPSGVHPCIMTTHHFDVLIIGSGLAGLTAALKLAPTHRVAVVTKRGISDGSSNWAQGPPYCNSRSGRLTGHYS